MIGMQLVEFAASFIEAELGIWIQGNVLQNENGETRKTAVASFFIALIIWWLNQYKLYSLLTTIVGILIIAAGANWVYKTDMTDSIILTAFYVLVIYVIDFLSASFLGVVMKEERYAHLVAESFSYERLYFILLSKSILAIVAYVFMNGLTPHYSISVRKLWVGITACVVILYCFIQNTFMQISYITLFSWGLFFLFILMGLYSVLQYMRYTHEKNQMRLVMERTQMQLDTYSKVIQDYLDKQIFYHDLKNHYIVIENYLDLGEYDKAKEYMNRLKMSETGAEYRRRTGIQAVDILLDCKIKEAESYEINVSVTADLIHVGMSDQECTALIGNALDNAIEACRSMEHGVKWIRIAISRVQEMTLIKVCNSCEKVPEVRFGEFISGKQNPGLHGLGIKSMKLIVDKYGGKMKTEYSAGEFSVVILFFY